MSERTEEGRQPDLLRLYMSLRARVAPLSIELLLLKAGAILLIPCKYTVMQRATGVWLCVRPLIGYNL